MRVNFKMVFLILIFVLPVSMVGDAEPDLVLVAPQGEVNAGQQLSFSIYYNNPAETAIQTNAIFKPVSCRISSGTKTLEVIAEPETRASSDTIVTLPGNGFKKSRIQILSFLLILTAISPSRCPEPRPTPQSFLFQKHLRTSIPDSRCPLIRPHFSIPMSTILPPTNPCISFWASIPGQKKPAFS